MGLAFDALHSDGTYHPGRTTESQPATAVGRHAFKALTNQLRGRYAQTSTGRKRVGRCKYDARLGERPSFETGDFHADRIRHFDHSANPHPLCRDLPGGRDGRVQQELSKSPTGLVAEP